MQPIQLHQQVNVEVVILPHGSKIGRAKLLTGNSRAQSLDNAQRRLNMRKRFWQLIEVFVDSRHAVEDRCLTPLVLQVAIERERFIERLKCFLLLPLDRKSTRLNSSHANSSYT